MKGSVLYDCPFCKKRSVSKIDPGWGRPFCSLCGGMPDEGWEKFVVSEEGVEVSEPSIVVKPGKVNTKKLLGRFDEDYCPFCGSLGEEGGYKYDHAAPMQYFCTCPSEKCAIYGWYFVGDSPWEAREKWRERSKPHKIMSL